VDHGSGPCEKVGLDLVIVEGFVLKGETNVRPCELVGHVLSPEEGEAEVLVAVEGQGVGEVKIVGGAQGMDEGVASLEGGEARGELDVEFGYVGVVEVIEVALLRQVLELRIRSCLLYHLN
jgi:hypothetical protein